MKRLICLAALAAALGSAQMVWAKKRVETGPVAPVSTTAAKTLIVNANGYTLDAKGNVIRFATLLVGADGTLVSVLPKGAPEPKLAPGDYRLDVRGQTILPGLIDSHMHLLQLGLSLKQLDLRATTDLAQAQARIKAAADANPMARWILGQGWNHERWALGRFPTHAELDAAHAERPVWLERIDGHAGWANSAAMRAAGITKATKDPEGGRIVRDAAGNPTGVFIDKAMDLIRAHARLPSAGDQEQAFEAVMDYLPRLGITGVHDMGTSAQTWALMRQFGDDARLSVRITAYADGMAAMEAISPLRPTKWLYDERLKLQGIKLVVDGALGSRGAALLAPYTDAPKERGLILLPDTRMKNLFSRANFLGYQIAAHAVGDAANRQVLDGLGEMLPTYGAKFRNRIEHAQVLALEDMPRLKDLQLVASMQPVQAVSDAQMALARLGPDRLSGAYAWKQLAEMGVPLAFGSGAPVEAANPFLGMQAALESKPGVGFQQALAGFTIGAAHAGGHDLRVGQLASGFWADFILLDRDPFQTEAEDLDEVQVQETWLAGKRIYVRPN